MKNEKNNTMYYKPVYHEEFPIGAYFRDNYNANVDTIQFGGRYDFNACKEYLDNNDELILIHKYEVIPVKNDKIEGMKIIYEAKDPFKNYIIVLSYSEKQEEGIVQIHYSCDRTSLDEVVDKIKVFSNESANKKVGLILRDDFGLTLKKFDVSPGDMSVEENYCDDFKDISDKIVDTLNTDDNTGLVLLHGKPGSGKTTYIRHLSTLLDKDIMFVPNNMADILTSPEFIPFIMKFPNSIIIIEDAEKVIRSRESGGNNEATSNILNMSDGILGECLKTQIIATFNIDRENIDKALLRKGRLIAEYEFNELDVDKSNKLLKKLNIDFTTKEPMLLTDIYNYEDNIGINDNKKQKIGF
jgi:hypothetical protein